MGLFDYIKDIGKKVFGSSADADAAEKVKNYILSDNPGVENLLVQVEDSTVTLSGSARDQASREKTILLAGNVEGIEKVQAEGLTAPSPVMEIKVDYYEIQKGDTLWKISEKFLGKGSEYTFLFEENKEVIKNPDLIYPGQKIRIPHVNGPTV